MAVNQKNTKPGQPDDFLRIQDLLYLCLARWKWFVLSLAITTGVAAVYLLCTPAVYTRTASVLIKEDSNPGIRSSCAAKKDCPKQGNPFRCMKATGRQ